MKTESLSLTVLFGFDYLAFSVYLLTTLWAVITLSHRAKLFRQVIRNYYINFTLLMSAGNPLY